MTPFASLVFIALLLAACSAGLLIGHRWGLHQAHSDPAHIDRMARKDRRIEELEESNAKLKVQRDKVLESYRLLKDERKNVVR